MRQITAVEQFVAKMAHLFPSSYGTRTLLILLDCDRKPTVYTTIARLLFHYTNRQATVRILTQVVVKWRGKNHGVGILFEIIERQKLGVGEVVLNPDRNIGAQVRNS